MRKVSSSWIATDTVKVAASRPVELNPFYIDTIYEVSGRKIAYMVYNEFSTGPNNQATDTEYREQMKQIFARFKRAVTPMLLFWTYDTIPVVI